MSPPTESLTRTSRTRLAKRKLDEKTVTASETEASSSLLKQKKCKTEKETCHGESSAAKLDKKSSKLIASEDSKTKSKTRQGTKKLSSCESDKKPEIIDENVNRTTKPETSADSAVISSAYWSSKKSKAKTTVATTKCEKSFTAIKTNTKQSNQSISSSTINAIGKSQTKAKSKQSFRSKHSPSEIENLSQSHHGLYQGSEPSKPMQSTAEWWAQINFEEDRLKAQMPKSFCWPKLLDKSKNVFHLLLQNTMRCSPFEKKQSFARNQVISELQEYDIVYGDHPFSNRITTIDWHPRIDNLFCVGAKHGDIGFYRLAPESISQTKQIKVFNGIGPGGYISAFKFHATDDNKFYTSSLDGKVCLRDLEKDYAEEQVFLNTCSWEHWYCSLDVHKSDNYLVAGANNGLTHLLSKSGEPIWQKRLHNQKVSHLEFSPREPYLLCSASLDHTVRMWDLRMMIDKKPLDSLKHDKGINSAYFSLTDGTRLLTTDQGDELRVYRAPFWHLETTIKHPHRFFQHLTPIKACWHPLADVIVCGRFPDNRQHPQYGDRRAIDVFDATSTSVQANIMSSQQNGIISLCKFNNTGDKLLSAMGYNLHIWQALPSKPDSPTSNIHGDLLKTSESRPLPQSKRKKKQDKTIDVKLKLAYKEEKKTTKSKTLKDGIKGSKKGKK
ncbi:DNA damage-binding protein 2-like isoform X2 [Physella acuta]|nr:DNA damage-binding protein 2-like isoform X2 [Physella acuta]